MIEVWRVNLDTVAVPPPTSAEEARAARFATEELSNRYLAAHGALREILGRFTSQRLQFALGERGKPYLPMAPEVRFNLAHSRGRALIAVSLETEVGVDVEQIRPMPNYVAMIDRFFPPGAEEPADEQDFFRVWTRFEALLKACGVGLYGAGVTVEGEWTIEEVDAGEGYAGAVAAAGLGHTVKIHDFGANE